MTEPLPPPPPLDEALLQLEVMRDFSLVVEDEAVEGATVAATADEETADVVVGTWLVPAVTVAVVVVVPAV